jgi:hypothetical protein
MEDTVLAWDSLKLPPPVSHFSVLVGQAGVDQTTWCQGRIGCFCSRLYIDFYPGVYLDHF